MIKVSRSRSLLKAILWRIIAFFTTTLIAYGITGEIVLSLEIGLFESMVKIVAYYYYERFWLKVRWGIEL